MTSRQHEDDESLPLTAKAELNPRDDESLPLTAKAELNLQTELMK